MLRLEGIRAGYRRTEVLHGVDLVVPTGAAVALLGANGAGKSTLLKVVAGLLPHTAGTVCFGDERVNDLSIHERARRGLCLIPEGRAIFRQLTVEQNIAMQARGRNVGEAIDRAADAFPVLAERLGQTAGTLSGGQQQMLALARALVCNPTLILADELSVGLAPVIVDEIFEAVTALRSSGAALLIVEQYVERALAIADYVYVLHKGRIAYVGEPALCRPEDIYCQYLGTVA